MGKLILPNSAAHLKSHRQPQRLNWPEVAAGVRLCLEPRSLGSTCGPDLSQMHPMPNHSHVHFHRFCQQILNRIMLRVLPVYVSSWMCQEQVSKQRANFLVPEGDWSLEILMSEVGHFELSVCSSDAGRTRQSAFESRDDASTCRPEGRDLPMSLLFLSLSLL